MNDFVTTIDDGPFHRLVRVRLDREPAAADVESLSLAERERAARFVFDRDRRRYLVSHIALRRVLAERTSLPPAALIFRANEFGKPELQHAGAPRFNMSRSGETAVVRVDDRHPVGVDIEALRAVDDAAELIAHHFTPEEQAEWHDASLQQRARCFLLGWTRKEACVKAIGVGLSLATNSFRVGMVADECDVLLAWREAEVCVRVRSFVDDNCTVVSTAEVIYTESKVSS